MSTRSSWQRRICLVYALPEGWTDYSDAIEAEQYVRLRLRAGTRNEYPLDELDAVLFGGGVQPVHSIHKRYGRLVAEFHRYEPPSYQSSTIYVPLLLLVPEKTDPVAASGK